MSEPDSLRLLVGGQGALRFGVPLDRVARVAEFDELESPRRVVDLPRLFDLPTAAEAEDRYARVEDLDEVAYLRLGPVARAESIAGSQVAPMPLVLATVAARWGWTSIARTDEGVIVIVDPLRLGALGARREEEA